MIEAEGHVFVTRPIVEAKETAGEGNHTFALAAFIRRPIVTPIRLSDKDDAFVFLTGRHTGGHNAGR